MTIFFKPKKASTILKQKEIGDFQTRGEPFPNVYDFIFGKQQNSSTKREMLLKLMTYMTKKSILKGKGTRQQ